MNRSVGSVTTLHRSSQTATEGRRVRQEAEGDAGDGIDDKDNRYARPLDAQKRHHHHSLRGQAGTSTVIDGSLGLGTIASRMDVKKNRRMTITLWPAALLPPEGASVASWSAEDVADALRHHSVPCAFALSLLFFMGVEYTLRMVPPSSPPFDIGFLLTRSLHGLLATSPALNSTLAALNTVFVGMQTAYIVWTLLVEGRPRPTISALFMFTCRGILGYATQLPLPQEFLGSGMDFPVGNVSFFLFFSGHVAGSVIASVDMRRMRRFSMAWTFDALNILQGMRLLATRGHYTIDLAVGAGAGFLFDLLAGKYEESKKHVVEHRRP